MRIAVGMIMQETHSFSPLATGIEEFRSSPLVPLAVGQDMLRVHGRIGSEVGGFMAACEIAGAEVVPLLATFAVSSGPVTSDAYAWLKSMLLDRLKEAGQLDGLLLALHGSMTTEGLDDPEGDILHAARGLLGANVRIGCSLDLHANLTGRMLDNADVLLSYETHVDHREIGKRVGSLLIRCLRDRLKPKHHMRKLPMVYGNYRSMLDSKRKVESEAPRVLAVSVLACNPWTDVDEFGPAIVVTTDGPNSAGDAWADALAREYWLTRDRGNSGAISVEEAVALARAHSPAANGPLVFTERGDLTGGGGTGDDVTLLSEMVVAGIDSLAAVIYDPHAVDKAFRLGIGSNAVFEVGGRHGNGGAPPLPFPGNVVRLFAGDIALVGVPYSGLRAPLGRTAVVGRGDVHIALTSKRIHPQGSAIFDALGVDVCTKRAVACKGHSAGSFAVPFMEAVSVDTPGLTMWDFTKIPYRKVSRPRYPLDDVDFGGGA